MKKWGLAWVMIWSIPALAQSSPFSVADRAEVIKLLPDVKKELDARLPDYPSTRIRDAFGRYAAQKGTGAKTYFVCGSINFKNQLGGYSGWQDFLAMPITETNSMLLKIGDGASALCSLPNARDDNDLSTLLTANK